MEEKKDILESIELTKNEWELIIIILEFQIEYSKAIKDDKENIEIIKDIKELIEVQLDLNEKLNKKKSH